MSLRVNDLLALYEAPQINFKCWAGMLAGRDPPRHGADAKICGEPNDKGLFEQPVPSNTGTGKKTRPNGLRKHTCSVCKDCTDDAEGIYIMAIERPRLFSVDAGQAEQWKCTKPNGNTPYGRPNTNPNVLCKLIAQSKSHPSILVLAPDPLVSDPSHQTVEQFRLALPQGVRPLFDDDRTKAWFDDHGGLPLVGTSSIDQFDFRPKLCAGWTKGGIAKRPASGGAAAGTSTAADTQGTDPAQSSGGAAAGAAADIHGTDHARVGLDHLTKKLEEAIRDRDAEPDTSSAWQIANREVDVWQKYVNGAKDIIDGEQARLHEYVASQTRSLGRPRSLAAKGIADSPESSPESSPRVGSLRPPTAADPTAEASTGADARRAMNTVIAALEAFALDADDYEVAERLASRRSKLE